MTEAHRLTSAGRTTRPHPDRRTERPPGHVPQAIVLGRIRTWWARRYPDIMEDLGFDLRRDEAADRVLAALLDAPPIMHRSTDPRALAHRGPIVVAGASPRLGADLAAHPLRQDEHLIAADGAVVPLDRLGIRPDLVVTDLDGPPDALLAASARGIPLAVHAHGDNIEAMRDLVPRLRGPVLGTTQRPSHRGPLSLPGGFTDGDRSVCVGVGLGATRIRLVGFDLDGEPGPWTARPNLPLKRHKMWWAGRNLRDLATLGVPVVLPRHLTSVTGPQGPRADLARS